MALHGANSRVKPRKIRTDKGTKRGPRPKRTEQVVEPSVVEALEQVATPKTEVAEYIYWWNALFGLDVTLETLQSSKQTLERHVAYLVHEGVHETQIPLYLQDSMEYALYRVAMRFGLVDMRSDPFVKYGTIQSRFVDTMERTMRNKDNG